MCEYSSPDAIISGDAHVPSSAVALCHIVPRFTQCTVSPAEIVMVAGAKAYSCCVTSTVCGARASASTAETGPVAWAVGASAGGAVAVGDTLGSGVGVIPGASLTVMLPVCSG